MVHRVSLQKFAAIKGCHYIHRGATKRGVTIKGVCYTNIADIKGYHYKR